MKTCIVDGCDGKQKTREMCNRHYLHWMKYGDPLGGKTHRKRGAPGLSAKAMDTG